EIGPRRGVIEANERVADVDMSALENANLFHNSALEVLNGLLAPLGRHHAAGDNRACQRGKGRPTADHAKRDNDDQVANAREHARIIPYPGQSYSPILVILLCAHSLKPAQLPVRLLRR